MPKKITDQRARKPYEKRTKTPEQALSSLMRYAAKAERSSGDALRLMRNWGVEEEDRSKILHKLEQDRFIDDERFAEAYVRDKIRFAGWGVYKIRSGLSTKGISKEIAERALASIGKGENEDRLLEIMKRKTRSLKAENAYELKTKLVRYGMSRGFEYDEVIDAATKIASEFGETED